MSIIKEMPLAGLIVIIIILVLFLLAVIMLFSTFRRYRRLVKRIDLRTADPRDPLMSDVKREFAKVYREFGESTNTPAIITSVFTNKLGGRLTAERFMNSAVSSFVTLGLFGTFLGLSLSVSSLTSLISLSNTEEWLSILNSVGGGLVSSLSGMGVAFYTSLAGVVCAIIFTILRTIFNPQAAREALENRMELWLDHSVAPTLETEYASDDAEKLLKLSNDLRNYTRTVQATLNECAQNMQNTLSAATASLSGVIEQSKEPIRAFYSTVDAFGKNTRDFANLSYELEGTIERLDLTVRDLNAGLKKAGGEKKA